MVIDDNKEEKLPVIADYNLDKTAPSKMSKKERVWVLVLCTSDRQTRSHGGHKNMILFKSFMLQTSYSKAKFNGISFI